MLLDYVAECGFAHHPNADDTQLTGHRLSDQDATRRIVEYITWIRNWVAKTYVKLLNKVKMQRTRSRRRTPSYLSRHIKPKIPARHLRSSSHQLLQKPTTRTHFADRAFRCTPPTVWRSLNSYTVDSGSIAVFKSRLKTFLFHRTFHPV